MSKGAKETIVARLGFKSGSAGGSKAEVELERLRRENAHLRKKVDEVAKRQAKPPDPEKGKLLEVVAQAQLAQWRRDGEQRDRSFQKLMEEMENLKNQLAASSARCQLLEGRAAQTGAVPSGDLAVVQDQLRDALEKNQQWMTYDQQREAYVRSVLAHTAELEQQLAHIKQANPEASKAASAVVPGAQSHSEHQLLLQGLQRDLEAQRQAASRAHLELQQHKNMASSVSMDLRAQKEAARGLLEDLAALRRTHGKRSDELAALQRSYGERSLELEHTKDLLQAERLRNRQVANEERMVPSGRMREELETMDTRLEEERKRSADLLLQVNLLQKSLLTQAEEQRRIATLEQQVQLSAMDHQSMQRQLHKVLKELRKARDHTAMEAKLEFDRLAIRESGPESPSKVGNLLDESFLECPRCRTSYSASQHRELLAHIDYCLA